MKEYLFLYRTNYEEMTGRSDAEAASMMKKWMDWLGNIAGQNRLVSKGNRLHDSGKVIRDSVVTNGPYTDIKESLGGYSQVKADSYDEAVELAMGCPILQAGGSVEVREIDTM